MTKRLFLIRHAEAEAANFEIKDIDRSLTADGEVVASKVGKYLEELIGQPDVILSSAALRTRQTAALVAEQLTIDIGSILFKEDLYEASTRILLREVNELSEAHDKVLLIAHNPGIPYFAEYISGDILYGVSPGGIVELSIDCEWAEVSQKTVDLVKYHTPPNS